jgi:hypothetical protein
MSLINLTVSHKPDVDLDYTQKPRGFGPLANYNTTGGIRCADHATPSMRKKLVLLRQEAAVARSA